MPGKGRYGKALRRRRRCGAAAVTTVADRFAARPPGRTTSRQRAARRKRGRPARPARSPRSTRVRWRSRAGGVAITTTWLSLINVGRMWARGGSSGTSAADRSPWAAPSLGWDFIYYWNHRFMHESRYMWAIHVVHHSSERYNLSTALRQPVADVLGTVRCPTALLASLRHPPARCSPRPAASTCSTSTGSTPTPSASSARPRRCSTRRRTTGCTTGRNRQYIDRNHGSILIVWDRLFGTFEREDETVVYGLTKNIDTYNPITVATHEHRDIVRDVAGSTNWRDRLSFVLRGPGWAYDRHRQLAAEGNAIVDDPDDAVTAA